jgi:acetylglutamate/LysW-gamma-L-alpha-aminoadipate kinase
MTLVVKIGGAAGNAVEPVLAEIVGLSEAILVHGGSEEVDRLGEALHVPSRYYTSPSGAVSRYTDPARLEVVSMALAGKINPRIVARLQALGARPIGLSGLDGPLLVGPRKEGARSVVDGKILRVKDDWSGTIAQVDDRLLCLLLGAGYLPVISPPAITPAGEVINVDSDRVAAAIAGALHAETLVLLTNVPGLLRDIHDPASRIDRIPREEIEKYREIAGGRMKKKLAAAQEAVERGVGRVVIASSIGDRPIAKALAGEGTVIE